MPKKIKIIIFIILCITQLLIISLSVYKGRKKGKLLYLKITLRDPYDPLRGRFLALRFEEEVQKIDDFPAVKNSLEKGMEIYCKFNDSGRIISISKIKPLGDIPFLKSKIKYISNHNNTFSLDFTFNNYYIQENYAKNAEKIIREDSDPTLVLSLDKNGNAKIKELLVYNMKIEKYIKYSRK